MTIAIGFFDGVHCGHQKILSGADAALTFREHPLATLNPSRLPPYIMSFEERVLAIRECGIKEVFVLDFNRDLAKESPADFLLRLRDIAKGSSHLAIRAGENWRFGRDGAGDANFVRDSDLKMEVVPYAQYEGAIVSSTRIRDALAKGDIASANKMLGRDWKRDGEIVSGKGVGREIGFPTINVKFASNENRVEIPCGVYAVSVAGKRAIANYGFAPTFENRAWSEKICEVHFPFDNPPEITSSRLAISFRAFLRREKKFANVEELATQIKKDIEECSQI